MKSEELIMAKKQNKFKVGDIVKALPGAPYTYTNQENEWIGVVTEIVNRVTFRAETVSCNYNFTVGSLYTLSAEYFEKVPLAEITISTDGKNTFCVLKHKGIVRGDSIAKCSPEDDFDFKAGARIALERLFSSSRKHFDELKIKKPFVPSLYWYNQNFGKIGEPTDLRDSEGNPLFIGDTVKTFSRTTGSYYGVNYVCRPTEGKETFVMGIAGDCSTTERMLSDWIITKVGSYTDLNHGEEHDGVVAKLQED